MNKQTKIIIDYRAYRQRGLHHEMCVDKVAASVHMPREDVVKVLKAAKEY